MFFLFMCSLLFLVLQKIRACFKILNFQSGTLLSLATNLLTTPCPWDQSHPTARPRCAAAPQSRMSSQALGSSAVDRVELAGPLGGSPAAPGAPLCRRCT